MRRRSSLASRVVCPTPATLAHRRRETEVETPTPPVVIAHTNVAWGAVGGKVLSHTRIAFVTGGVPLIACQVSLAASGPRPADYPHQRAGPQAAVADIPTPSARTAL